MNNKYPFNSSRLHFSKGQGAIILLLLFILLTDVFYLGYRYYSIMTLRNGDTKSQIEKLAVVEKILQDNYLFMEEVPTEQVFDGAIKGMTASMGDVYTRYISERDYQEFKSQTQGKFGGIGVTFDPNNSTNQGIIITSTLAGKGAELAGLKPNDTIVAVDGKEIKGMELKDAIALIKGDIGTSVTLTVIREGEKNPVQVVVERKEVEISSVTKKVLNREIGYISYRTFSETSLHQFDEAYLDLKEKRIKALILDLRSNPGGLVNISVDIASRFLGENEEVVKVISKNHETELKTKKSPYTIDVPVYILIDRNTASASEILSGTLKDHNKAVLIGENTYGKGLIQETFPVDNESALIITVSKYVTPNGEDINLEGISPQHEISLDAEDLLKGIDTQLEYAIKLVEEEKERR